MKPGFRTFLLTGFFALLLSACNLGRTEPDAAATLNPLYTAAAQTLAAMSTQAVETPITGNDLSKTPTLSFLSPTPYKSPVPVTLCDAAAFITDVTIPDGSEVSPGITLTKTWRMKNVGTCHWTSSYALVFVSGDKMSAPTSIKLSGNVAPGDTVDLTTTLISPSKNGHYRGFWKLRNASGALFGIGPQADTAFWVDINVSGPEHIAYDFTANACNADWKSNKGALPCPGDVGDDKGYVRKLSNPIMENGIEENQPGLLTVPKHTANGYIQGKYPAIQVQQDDHFVTSVNCQYNAQTCDVLFRFEYKVGDGEIITLAEWQEIYEGKYYSVDQDLSFLAGKSARFYLTVMANNSKGKDYAIWLAPRIIRRGTPPPTYTPTTTATPTETVTPTLTPTATPTSTATP